jgi:hypothetical protein
MALTKEQIVNRFIPRTLVKRNQSIVWGDVVSAVATATTLQKQAMVDALKAKNYAEVGRAIAELLMVSLTEEIRADINTKLANNSLNLDELSELL